MIVPSAHQALFIATAVLVDSDDTVWVEDPGYSGARGIMQNTGAQVVAVPVDRDGLSIEQGTAIAPDVQLIYVTPSHQFPLGITMSLARRIELLNFAEESGAWILEDDYDSEYRYVGHPLASLQGMDRYDRVIYVGTFSKVMFPAIRLGYMVIPSDLVDAFVIARGLLDRYSPLIPQAILAEFIMEGHFIRHLRRMRKLYAEKKTVLEDSSRRHLGDRLVVRPSQGGMHLVADLPEQLSAQHVAAAARRYDVLVSTIADHLAQPNQHDNGLLLGYTGVPITKIATGIHRISEAINRLERG